MHKKLFLLIVIMMCFILNNTAQRKKSVTEKQTNRWHNPVLDKDFPDPAVIRFTNGKYYAYATQGWFNGKQLNIQVASSDDMFNWKMEGDALPQKPLWASATWSFWAPDVLYDTLLKKYVLFFSSGTNDTTQGKCIGVAFADLPEGPFIDKGSPLICGEGFVNIDPKPFIDPATGKKLLFWGSGFQPLKVQELSDDWTTFKPGTTPQNLVWPGNEKSYTALVEGSWVDYQDGYYYLYYSGDNCCGPKAKYAVMIARATTAFGPYTRLGETNTSGSSVILEQDERWLAPGHNSIFTDAKGNEWIAYHAIDRRMPSDKTNDTRRVMLINPVIYKNGWPVIIKQP